jgi:hypothetical protein
VVQNFGCLIFKSYDEAKEKCLEFLTLHIDNGFGNFSFRYLSTSLRTKWLSKKLNMISQKKNMPSIMDFFF